MGIVNLNVHYRIRDYWNTLSYSWFGSEGRIEMDYRPNLTDEQEHIEDMRYALEETITSLNLILDELKGFREFEYLRDSVEITLDEAKEELRGLEDGE